MLVGCFLRSGVPNPLESADSLVQSMPSYSLEVLGTVCVGAAQPFFQCAPPLLSATWFAPSERALATATAINFNQVGIATAFIVGGAMANTPAGMHSYFDLITIFALVGAGLTTRFFYERPEQPPSASAAAERREEEARAEAMRARGEEPRGFDLTRLSYPSKAAELLRKPGFVFATAAFVASIGCTNVVSAFTAPELARAGLEDGFGIDLAGAGFQFAIVLGGIGLGRYVDLTKRYKSTMLACFGVAASALTALGVSEGYDQTFAAPAVLGLLFLLGASAGPVQPIAAELAVETSYPCDENAVESTQQLAGNLFSALLVPICEAAAEGDLQFPGEIVDLRGDTIVLMTLLITVALYFSRFDSPLLRTQLDNAE
jgi:FLVCR family MFS transporter 7